MKIDSFLSIKIEAVDIIDIDYNDVVQWQENFGTLATARQGMIGIKSNVRQVDNAIVFTIRGDFRSNDHATT